MIRVDQRILDRLANDCQTQPYDIVVSKWMVDSVPVLFNGNKDEYLRIKALIASKLEIDICSVVFVGSSSLGFSLNPNKNFKTFDSDSDIDIAVISHYYFNEAWHNLRRMDVALLSKKEMRAYNSHRSHYIFDGTIATDRILSQLSFGKAWRASIAELRRDPVFGNREIHFRLYQDHKSLIDYHISNIKNVLPNMIGVAPQVQQL